MHRASLGASLGFERENFMDELSLPMARAISYLDLLCSLEVSMHDAFTSPPTPGVFGRCPKVHVGQCA